MAKLCCAGFRMRSRITSKIVHRTVKKVFRYRRELGECSLALGSRRLHGVIEAVLDVIVDQRLLGFSIAFSTAWSC